MNSLPRSTRLTNSCSNIHLFLNSSLHAPRTHKLRLEYHDHILFQSQFSLHEFFSSGSSSCGTCSLTNSDFVNEKATWIGNLLVPSLSQSPTSPCLCQKSHMDNCSICKKTINALCWKFLVSRDEIFSLPSRRSQGEAKLPTQKQSKGLHPTFRVLEQNPKNLFLHNWRATMDCWWRWAIVLEKLEKESFYQAVWMVTSEWFPISNRPPSHSLCNPPAVLLPPFAGTVMSTVVTGRSCSGTCSLLPDTLSTSPPLLDLLLSVENASSSSFSTK